MVWDGGVNGVFNSPDANANYYFAERLYQGQSFAFPLPYDDIQGKEYISTRSTRVIDNSIIPVGFLGMTFLYGGLSKILFINLIPYLTIIFSTIIPGIIIAYKNRYWGYGYMIGFAIAGIPFLILIDLFIGGYTFATALFIFIILWLIFWKTWRALSSIKSVNPE